MNNQEKNADNASDERDAVSLAEHQDPRTERCLP